jgi:hypothetical protein
VVREVVEHLKLHHGASEAERTIREEHVSFPLPRALRQLVPSGEVVSPVA